MSDLPTNDSTFYDDEFDGVVSDSDRSTMVAAAFEAGGFGLPLDLQAIDSERPSDEFDASAEITRGVGALEFGGPRELDLGVYDPNSAEFDVGATFHASSAIFASPEPLALEQPEASPLALAPPLPPYLKPSRTSFSSAKPADRLRADLESAFAATSVTFCPADEALASEGERHPCAYACTSVCLLSVITFEVRIFALPASPAPKAASPRHLVEVRHLSGCRYAFKETAQALADSLGVAFGSSTPAAPSPSPWRALPLPEGLALPTLRRADATAVPPPPTKKTQDLKAATPDSAAALPLSAPVLDSLFSSEAESSPRERAEGLRAVGAQLSLSAAWVATNDAVQWGCIADRVTALARPSSSSRHGGAVDDEEEDGARAVAMSVVADLAARPQAPQAWLEAAVAAVAEGAGDDSGHVRREALRAAAALAERDEGAYAAKLVRAGAVPALELEASGGDGESCPDDAARRFAEAALLACRRGG